VVWETAYLLSAVARLRAVGYPVRDEDVILLSPYIRRHLYVQGHDSVQQPDLAGAQSRPRVRESATRQGGPQHSQPFQRPVGERAVSRRQDDVPPGHLIGEFDLLGGGRVFDEAQIRAEFGMPKRDR
jgi:hypothetical protein